MSAPPPFTFDPPPYNDLEERARDAERRQKLAEDRVKKARSFWKRDADKLRETKDQVRKLEGKLFGAAVLKRQDDWYAKEEQREAEEKQHKAEEKQREAEEKQRKAESKRRAAEDKHETKLREAKLMQHIAEGKQHLAVWWTRLYRRAAAKMMEESSRIQKLAEYKLKLARSELANAQQLNDERMETAKQHAEHITPKAAGLEVKDGPNAASLNQYLQEDELCDNAIRLHLKGTATYQGTILIRRTRNKGKCSKFSKLGHPMSTSSTPTVNDIIVDDNAPNLRLLVQAYFMVRDWKLKLQKVWEEANQHRVAQLKVVQEEHELREPHPLLLKIAESAKHEKILVTVLDATRKGGPDKTNSTAPTVLERRLLFSRDQEYDADKGRANSKIFVNVYDGGVVIPNTGDVILAEIEETYWRLSLFADQVVFRYQRRFPELWVAHQSVIGKRARNDESDAGNTAKRSRLEEEEGK